MYNVVSKKVQCCPYVPCPVSLDATRAAINMRGGPIPLVLWLMKGGPVTQTPPEWKRWLSHKADMNPNHLLQCWLPSATCVTVITCNTSSQSSSTVSSSTFISTPCTFWSAPVSLRRSGATVEYEAEHCLILCFFFCLFIYLQWKQNKIKWLVSIIYYTFIIPVIFEVEKYNESIYLLNFQKNNIISILIYKQNIYSE